MQFIVFITNLNLKLSLRLSHQVRHISCKGEREKLVKCPAHTAKKRLGYSVRGANQITINIEYISGPVFTLQN